ncbi:hypothetical protein O6H91_05G011900 [Diphasiastrum complanatum]|uniref:Uncharacterized protein n=1 Tax=Diphasiastrum complanatum TaxID=34168 RepID=A0ACC2DKK0_DIPCM|nr:hypothetical protein O6H91_05G011900 [Diphasiastrum complanatum]
MDDCNAGVHSMDQNAIQPKMSANQHKKRPASPSLPSPPLSNRPRHESPFVACLPSPAPYRPPHIRSSVSSSPSSSSQNPIPPPSRVLLSRMRTFIYAGCRPFQASKCLYSLPTMSFPFRISPRHHILLHFLLLSQVGLGLTILIIGYHLLCVYGKFL